MCQKTAHVLAGGFGCFSRVIHNYQSYLQYYQYHSWLRSSANGPQEEAKCLVRIDQQGGPRYFLPKENFSYFRCKNMNVDDKIVVGDSGEGIAEVSGGTDEGVGGVCAGTNVVGSDGAAAAAIAVVTQGM
jgi:hypothetical protein